MFNLSKYALGAIAGIVIVLVAIVISNNAITSRLDGIAAALDKDAEREVLDKRIAEGEKLTAELAGTVEQLRVDLQAATEARNKLAGELAKAIANRQSIINLELYLILRPPGEYQVQVNVVNPPITSGIGEVLDKKHAIQIGQGPNGYLSVADRNLTQRQSLQYLVTQDDLENGEVFIDYSAAKKGGGEGGNPGAMKIRFKTLLEKGRTELELTNGATLIVLGNLGAGTIPTF